LLALPVCSGFDMIVARLFWLHPELKIEVSNTQHVQHMELKLWIIWIIYGMASPFCHQQTAWILAIDCAIATPWHFLFGVVPESTESGDRFALVFSSFRHLRGLPLDTQLRGKEESLQPGWGVSHVVLRTSKNHWLAKLLQPS